MKRLLEKYQPSFIKGGRFERLGALYEALYTFLYTPGQVTRGQTHVRDQMDFKRIMILVWLAALPATFFGLYNVGWQANSALASLGMSAPEGWRAALLPWLAAGFDPNSLWDNFAHGALYFLPIYFVTFVVGGFWEVVFATVRGKEINEGFFVTSILFALTLPPTIPLWQVAVGISFGVVIAKELFGGTGRNFVNPALAGRAFIYFAYPAQMSGDAVWVAVDGYSGATPLAIAKGLGNVDGVSGATVAGQPVPSAEQWLSDAGVTFADAFWGFLPGSMGETSTFAILIGAALLLYTRIASWRIMLSMLLGMIGMSLIFNAIGSDTNSLYSLPPHWHFVLGGFAFGLVFMATDPVSAALTPTGKWIYGALIGALAVIIRVVNPAYPEGTMLAILFGNLMAPLIDHFVVQANIKRRMKRHAG